MEETRERWERLVDEVGLANATRQIMAEHPGQGDSVEELRDIWGDMTVTQIYETILAEQSSRPAAQDTTGLWDDVREGANAFISFLTSPVEATPATAHNSLVES